MSVEGFLKGISGGTNIGTTPTTFSSVQRAVFMDTGGDLTFTMEDGNSLALTGMTGGVWHPMRFTAITVITTATGVAAGN